MRTVQEPGNVDPWQRGRKPIPMKHMVFACAFKVYTTFSIRRYGCDAALSVERHYIPKTPRRSTISEYMCDENMTHILHELIAISALPLQSVERDFAIDSTGLRLTSFNDYCRVTHHTGREHEWLKLHAICGVKTNIIPAAITGLANHSSDTREFIPLLLTTVGKGFKVEEISADKAYLSRNNLDAAVELGAIPFIPFKEGSTGKPRGHDWIWRRMYNLFTYNQSQFMEHYHKRSNVESTFNMIKSKFTDLIRSKDSVAQTSEALIKVLCHNICVLIQEMHELGIDPQFTDNIPNLRTES